MDFDKSSDRNSENRSLMLKRTVSIKSIVTPTWKAEAQQQIQDQINQLDSQLQQLEMQGQRMMAEIQKQASQIGEQQVAQQIDNIQVQVNQKKSELLEQKNKLLQQLQQIQTLEMEQEVNQGQLEGFFQVSPGDNLVLKMQVEVVLRDGVIEEIRGDL